MALDLLCSSSTKSRFLLKGFRVRILAIELRRGCEFRRDTVLTVRWYVMLALFYRRFLEPDYLLVAIKLLHTAVWAVMAGSILSLPVAAFTRHFGWALILTALIFCECAVLAANRGRCPLTDWAARFTSGRAANFDIYLPEWLARNNKAIFGTLFAVNELFVLWRWLVQP